MRRSARNVLALVAAVGVSSCTNSGALASAVEWRGGTVLSILTMRELDTALPLCNIRTAGESLSPGALVAVVRSRVGKASYDEAFVLGAGLGVSVGGRVRFDRAGCALLRMHEPVSS